MKLSDYVAAARSTAIYANRGKNPVYPILGLLGEVRELVEKIDEKNLPDAALELGDVVWYLVAFCDELGLDAERTLASSFEKKTEPSDDPRQLAVGLLLSIAGAAEVIKKVVGRGEPMTEKRTQTLFVTIQEVGSLMKLLASLLGTSIEEAMAANASKLLSRKERGVLKGDGDHR